MKCSMKIAKGKLSGRLLKFVTVAYVGGSMLYGSAAMAVFLLRHPHLSPSEAAANIHYALTFQTLPASPTAGG